MLLKPLKYFLATIIILLSTVLALSDVEIGALVDPIVPSRSEITKRDGTVSSNAGWQKQIISSNLGIKLCNSHTF